MGYLFAIPVDAGLFLIEKIQANAPLFLKNVITVVFADKSHGDTSRIALFSALLGQGKFRDDLYKIWHVQCAFSCISRRELLLASHIKPWSASNYVERLDLYNGLLLSVAYHLAFDYLLITFNLNGEPVFPPDFSLTHAKAVGNEAHA